MTSVRPTLDRMVQTTHEWLISAARELGSDDQAQAYQAMRAVLHALRDRLTPEEAAQLGAQLPNVIRGVYYEGWRPAHEPTALRHRDEFLARVAVELPDGGPDPEAATRAVFKVLAGRIAEGEIPDVQQMLPEPIRELWS